MLKRTLKMISPALLLCSMSHLSMAEGFNVQPQLPPEPNNQAAQNTLHQANTAPQPREQEQPKPDLPPPPQDQMVAVPSDNPDLPSATMETNNDAFRQAVIGAGVALTPDEIKKFHTLWIQSMEAQSAGTTIAKKTTAQYTVTLAPNESLPDVPLGLNMVSSLVFQDQTGAPWPITSAVLGNNTFFSLIIAKTGDHNLLMITPLRLGVQTNVIITLHGIDTPIILNLNSNDKIAQVRTTLNLRASGPKAKTMTFASEPRKVAGTPELIHTLTGVTPVEGAQRLYTAWPDTEIWRKDGLLYVRSAYSLVSPSWSYEAHSDTYNAWVLPWAPDLVFSVQGQERILHIDDTDLSAHG